MQKDKFNQVDILVKICAANDHFPKNMKQIKILKISFDTPILPYQLPAFRGAIAQKMSTLSDYFHNHDINTGIFLNRYPLVQYKIDTYAGKMQPSIWCIEAGVDAIQYLFDNEANPFKIGKQTITFNKNYFSYCFMDARSIV